MREARRLVPRQSSSGVHGFLLYRHVKSFAFSLHSDGNVTYCDVEPPAEVLSFFQRRRDNQIMSLELLSIAYG